MALFVLYNALSRTLQRGEAWRGMVELEHLAAFDCLQWLRTGERAAGVLGISQSTVSRATRIGAGAGSRSTAQQISDEGAAPCCRPGSQGPPAAGLVSATLPDTR